MPVIALHGLNPIKTRLDELALINRVTGIPYIGATLWMSLNETRYSTSRLRKYAYSIDKFYSHVENQSGDVNLLDRLIITANTKEISHHLRTFLAVLQNSGVQKGINNFVTLNLAVSFLIQTTEIMYIRTDRSSNNYRNINRELQNLKVLYKFLKPNKNVKKTQIRSIPPKVLMEIFELFEPTSEFNN